MSYKIEPRSMQEDYQVIHDSSYIERAKLNGYGSSKEKHNTLDDLGANGGDMTQAFGQTDRIDPTQQIQDPVDLSDQNSDTDDNGDSTNNPALDDIVYRLMQNPTASTKELHDNMELLSDQLQDLITTDKAGNTQHAGIQRTLQRGFDSFNKQSPTYQAFLKNLEENKENIADQLKKAEEKLNPKDDQEEKEGKTPSLKHRKTSLGSPQEDKKQQNAKIEGSGLSDKEKQQLEKKIQTLKGEVSDYQDIIDNVNLELQRAKDLQTSAKNHFEQLATGTGTTQQVGASTNTDQTGDNTEEQGEGNTNGQTASGQTHTGTIGGGKVRGPQDDIIDPYEAYKAAHPELFGGSSNPQASEGETTTGYGDTSPDPLQAYLTRRQQEKAQQGGTSGRTEEETKSLISQILSSSGQGSSLLDVMGDDGTSTSGLDTSGLSGSTGSSVSQAQLQNLLQQYQSQ